VAWQNGAERAPNNDLALPPIEVIRLYGLRFKIELSFKKAVRVLPSTIRAWSGLPSAPGCGLSARESPPAELVTAAALRNSLPDFSHAARESLVIPKIPTPTAALPDNLRPCDSPDRVAIGTLKTNNIIW
jgi:hypothetical protein